MMRQRTDARRRAVFVAVIVVLAVLFGYMDIRVHRSSSHEALAPPPNRFAVTAVHVTWHGQPVYQITNRTHSVLKRVTMTSWSDQVVPILYAGNTAPPHLDIIHPHVHPPIDLAPAESIWIAASFQKPYMLTVMWLDGGVESYQVYRIP